MSDKDLNEIDRLYEQIKGLYIKISENKCKSREILIDLEFAIKKIVTKKEFIEIKKIIDESIEKIKEW